MPSYLPSSFYSKCSHRPGRKGSGMRARAAWIEPRSTGVRRARACSLAVVLIGCLAAGLQAQCSTQWVPGEGFAGVGSLQGGLTQVGAVHAIAEWDPDGAGPAPSVIVVGGGFSMAGTTPVSNITIHDPVNGTWSAMGGGIDGRVGAMATLPNGNIVAGGLFTTAGGVPATSIARWNGATWSPLGAGLAGEVRALTTLPNGDLVAGGAFTAAGGVAVGNIARWNGVSWSALGAGMNGPVFALALLPNGDLVAGGSFSSAGGLGASGIARWNGTTWSPLGTGVSWMIGATNIGSVQALETMSNGDLVAGGWFTSAGGVPANGLARWNGASWFAMAAVATGANFPLASMSNGDLVAVANLGGAGAPCGGSTAGILERWNGATWRVQGTVVGRVNALKVTASGDLLVGGSFPSIDGVPAVSLARWAGSGWQPLGTASLHLGPLRALAVLPDGEVIAGGAWASGAGNLARWSGGSWTSFGTGPVRSVSALVAPSTGGLVAAWMLPGGCFVPNQAPISHWNGATWTNLGTAAGGGFVWTRVNALANLANGDLVAGGEFFAVGGSPASNIARWDGTSWFPLGPGTDEPVMALTRMPTGDLIVGGVFTTAGGVSANRIACWDGTSWSPLGTGVQSSVTFGWVLALTTLPNGDLIAAGDFTTAGGVAANNIARWNGTSWSPLGTGTNGAVGALTVLPNGDLVAAGAFTTAGGVPANNIARWDGNAWTAFGAGTDGPVHALATLPDGTIALGGEFTTAGGFVSLAFARLAPTCPASVQSYGAGCSGPGGALSLVADTLPWSSSLFRVTASGFGASSFGLAMLSVGQLLPGLPLQSTPVPGPGAGCTLGIPSLDLLAVTAPFGASTQSYQVPIAITPTMPGLAFSLQVAELDLSAGWVGTYTTNALRCTVGTY